MKLPEPTTEELMNKAMAQFAPHLQRAQRISTDTGITTPGAIATVIVAGVVFAAISPWWLLLATPLAIAAWGSEIKWWPK
jgi:hypothetical protein